MIYKYVVLKEIRDIKLNNIINLNIKIRQLKCIGQCFLGNI